MPCAYKLPITFSKQFNGPKKEKKNEHVEKVSGNYSRAVVVKQCMPTSYRAIICHNKSTFKNHIVANLLL